MDKYRKKRNIMPLLTLSQLIIVLSSTAPLLIISIVLSQ